MSEARCIASSMILCTFILVGMLVSLVAVTLDAGTEIHVRLVEGIFNIEKASGACPAILDRALEASGQIVVPEGSRVHGHVEPEESQDEREDSLPKIRLWLEAIKIEDKWIVIKTNVLRLDLPDTGIAQGTRLTFELSEAANFPDPND